MDYVPYVTAILIFLEIVCLHSFPEYSDNREEQIFTGVHHEVLKITTYEYPAIVNFFVWGIPIACFVISIVALVSKKWLSFVTVFLLIVCPFTFLGKAIQYLDPCSDIEQVKDSKGNEYHLIHNSFMQGMMLRTTRYLGVRGHTKSYEVLTTAMYDSPQYFLRTVRPKEWKDDKMLRLVDDHLLLAGLGDNRIFSIYDTAKEKPYGSTGLENNDIWSFSPFFLVRNGAEPNADDLKDVKKNLQDDTWKGDSKVLIQSLKQDLTVEDPRIRNAVKTAIKDLERAEHQRDH